MKFAASSSTNGRLWRGVLVIAAIIALTLTLANRFSVVPNSQARAVKSLSNGAGDTKQRLDQDAARFIMPVLDRSTFKPRIVCSHVLPLLPAPLSAAFFLSVYNRPPPFFLSAS